MNDEERILNLERQLLEWQEKLNLFQNSVEVHKESMSIWIGLMKERRPSGVDRANMMRNLRRSKEYHKAAKKDVRSAKSRIKQLQAQIKNIKRNTK